MKNKKLLTKALSILMILVLAAGMVIISTPASEAASSSGKLIKSVTKYYRVGSKWKKSGTIEYTYNKYDDPVKIFDQEVQEGESEPYSLLIINKYTYKKGKKTQRKEYLKYGKGKKELNTIITYDSKGRVKKNKNSGTYVYEKNGYVKKIKDGSSDSMVFKYTWNKDKAKTLTSSLVEGKKKYKVRYTEFNKKGYVKKAVEYPDDQNYRFYTYEFKDGLVKTITYKIHGELICKYKIKYTKKSIDEIRYRDMINSIAGDFGSTGTTWY